MDGHHAVTLVGEGQMENEEEEVMAEAVRTARKRSAAGLGLRRLISAIGPGLITGAADDDPSGIGTYVQTGAQFGYGQLWTALFVLPLLTAVQEATARVGAVTGRGLAAVIRDLRVDNLGGMLASQAATWSII